MKIQKKSKQEKKMTSQCQNDKKSKDKIKKTKTKKAPPKRTKKDLEQEKLEIQKKRTELYKNNSDPSKFYVSNSGLMEELIKWKNSAKNVKERRPSEEFGKMILAIAYRLTNHSYFRNYPYDIKMDMVSYACEKFMTGVENFNFKFKNPFAYFTQMCFNSFKTVLSKHYKQVNIKRALTRQAISRLEQTVPNSSLGKCLNNQFIDNEYVEME